MRENFFGPLNLNEESLRVCDIWDSDNNWCFDNISFYLPVPLRQAIQATLRPLVPHQEDCLF